MHKNKMVNRVVCFSPKSHSKDIVCLIVHGPQVSVGWVSPLPLAPGYVLGQFWGHCYNLKLAGERLTHVTNAGLIGGGEGRDAQCSLWRQEPRGVQSLPFITGWSTRAGGLCSDLLT